MLRSFREHLAEELRHFPQELGPSFESYAVTTAALARFILQYVGMDDVTVPARFGRRADRLKTVLDRIIHFRVLYPENVPLSDKGGMDNGLLRPSQTVRRPHERGIYEVPQCHQPVRHAKTYPAPARKIAYPRATIPCAGQIPRQNNSPLRPSRSGHAISTATA